MVCIYCGGKTTVTNSRPQKRLGQVWRRRQCVVCQAIFTTNEAIDLTTSLVVRSQGHTAPFSRDKLFISIFRAVGHRKQPINDAGALTDTVLAKCRLKAVSAALAPSDIVSVAMEVLQRFDNAAAVQYIAYHQN